MYVNVYCTVYRWKSIKSTVYWLLYLYHDSIEMPFEYCLWIYHWYVCGWVQRIKHKNNHAANHAFASVSSIQTRKQIWWNRALGKMKWTIK